MNKIFYYFIIAFLLPVNILNAQQKTKELKVVFIDVGHGDAVFIQTPSGHTALIDGGSKGKEVKIKSVLGQYGINDRIDTIILSNPNSEHVGGLVDIIDSYDVGNIYDPGMPFVQYDYERFMELIMKKQDQFGSKSNPNDRISDILARKYHFEYFNPRSGDVLNWGEDVKVTVLNPPQLYHNTRSDPNNNSIVIKLVYNNISFLFTGNIEAAAEQYLAGMGSKLNSTFIKVPNHGASFSGDSSFFNKVQAKYSIVMAGQNNKYGYPSLNVMELLKKESGKIYRTDLNGSIIVTTDGINCNIQPERKTDESDSLKTYTAEKGVDNSGNQYVQKPKININQASSDELVSISELGVFKAKMIVKYRNQLQAQNKKFESPDDLLNVPGINKSIIDKIKNQIIF